MQVVSGLFQIYYYIEGSYLMHIIILEQRPFFTFLYENKLFVTLYKIVKGITPPGCSSSSASLSSYNAFDGGDY